MRRGLLPWRTLSPQHSKKYRNPLNAWNQRREQQIVGRGSYVVSAHVLWLIGR